MIHILLLHKIVNQVSLDFCCEIKAIVTVNISNRKSFPLLYGMLLFCLCPSFFKQNSFISTENTLCNKVTKQICICTDETRR